MQGGDFQVDGYDIEGLLGTGPAGEVWLARELSSGEQVALKRVQPRSASAHEEARRLVDAVQSLNHPGVVPVREMLPYEDQLVFVLDYAAGGSLGQLLLARGTLDPGEVVTVGTAMADALAALHSRGLVHGDVTPDNVLLSDDGTPRLSDVGLLRLLNLDDQVEHGFQDPDPRGRTTPAGDVFSLAAVCYAALTGNPPGPSHRPLHQVAPGVPATLAHVIEAGLLPQPGQRMSVTQIAGQLAAACPAAPVRFPGGTTIAPSGRSHAGGPGVATRSPAVSPPRGPVGSWQATPDPRQSSRGGRTPTALPGMSGPGEPEREPDDGSAPRRRAVLALLVVVPVLLAGVGVAGFLGWQALAGPGSDPDPTTSPTSTKQPETPAATDAERRWTRVLTTLDQRRSRAWRRLDEKLLTTVYVEGSDALAEERDLMRLHKRQGVTSVVGLRTPILSLDVVSNDPERVVVDVVSQLQPYELKIDGQLYPHRGGSPKQFRMTLVPDGRGGWLIAQSRELR